MFSFRLQKILPAVTPQPDCLVHGDFRFGNVMVTDGLAPGISALLDWELATTGHPLADLGFLGARIRALAESLSPAPTRRPSMAFPPTVISLTVSTSAPACQSPTWRCSSR